MKFVFKNKVFIFVFILLLIHLLFMGYAAYNYSQSERFGDEAGHMVGGHFILKGRVPYTNMQFNHQPLVYMFSAMVEQITSPQNVYLYVARQREGTFLYAAVWNILYFFVFGPSIIFFSVIFEITKYWFSGYKLLGETLAVYPTVFILGIFMKMYLFKEKVRSWPLIVLSVATFVSAFSLLPIWPLLLFLNILILFHVKKNRFAWIFVIVPGLLLTIVLFSYLHLTDYIKETMTYNVKYFLPTNSKDFSILKMVLLPFDSFLYPYTNIKIVSAFFVIILIIGSYVAAKEKMFVWSLIIIALLLSNQRVDTYDYGSFHLLLWFGSLVFIGIYMIRFFSLKHIIIKKFHIARIFYGEVIILSVWIYCFTSNPLTVKKDLMNENYVNYSYSESYGKAIKIMKDRDDRLVAMPDDPVVHYAADIDMGTRILEYYGWIYTIPEYKKEIMTVMEKHPPEFIVDTGLNSTFDMEKLVQEHLKKDYIELDHVGKPSRLYVLNKKFKTINDEQWKKLNEMLFTK